MFYPKYSKHAEEEQSEEHTRSQILMDAVELKRSLKYNMVTPHATTTGTIHEH